MQTDHEDLTDNVNTSLNHDYSGSSNIYDPSETRGTRVSGVIAAAGDNSLGVRGVAPQASIYGYNLAGNLTSANAKDAMIRNRDITAVSINNWGPNDDLPILREASSEWEEGVGTGISEGFGGKGVFYVWAAGDGDKNSNLADHANFDEYSNYYAVTAVCSVDGEGNKSSFSEEGVNLWVCAPGEDITTTDNNDGYVFDASGTAYSAAQVAGVAALMREVNSKLSWRDLKLILAASARKNDASDTSWETGAHKYGSDTESYNYNPKYGFGVVDAEAAAGLAESWTKVAGMRTQTASSGTIDMTIPDRGSITSTLTIANTDLFTEFVEIVLNFTHDYFPELNIQITSPDGTVSQLNEGFYVPDPDAFKTFYTDKTHRFGSARHLGENPAGVWTLNISDTGRDDSGTLHSWSIKVYGHKTGDTVPSFDGKTIDNKEYVTGSAITTETLPAATNGNAPLTYSITPGLPAGLDFTPATRVISGTPTTATSRATYTYTVTDAEGDTDELTFGITISADVEPSFSDTIDDQEYIAGTATNLPVTLPAATGGNGELRYSITPGLPTGLSFDINTRVISGTPAAAESRTAYTYTVTDDDGDTADLTFDITVAANVEPGFSDTIDDQEYVAGTATNLPVTLPAATGGNAPLTYSITPGLPAGLDFTPATRVISGTPTTAASRTAYTYTVTDDDGDTANLTFGITISADVEPGFSDTIADQEYIAGKMTNLPVTLPAATGGNGELRYSITPALPTGLNFDNNTRVISGTPAAAASKNTYTYTVEDIDGDTTDLTFGITIEENSMPDFGSEMITDKEYFTGTAVTETLPVATGGNPPVTYSITPDLPVGLNFNASTREISGTPTTATNKITYTYTVTDEDGDAAELRFGVTVGSDVPTFSSTTITNKEYVRDTAVTETLPIAAGGNGALRYSLTPALPTGLDFNAATREISGTPTSTSSSDTYMYTVTDEDGDMDELSFTIRVVNRPAPLPPRQTPGTEAGGGGCTISDQSNVVSDLLGAVVSLMLIPVSVVIRRKIRCQIKT